MAVKHADIPELYKLLRGYVEVGNLELLLRAVLSSTAARNNASLHATTRRLLAYHAKQTGVVTPVAPPVIEPPGATVTILEACDLVDVSRRTIYNWIARDKVTYVRTAGGAVRIVTATLWPGPKKRG